MAGRRRLLKQLRRFQVVRRVYSGLSRGMERIHRVLAGTSPLTLQRVWSHKVVGTGPYQVTDCLGAVAKQVEKRLRSDSAVAAICVLKALGYEDAGMQGTKKLRQHATAILVGLVLGASFNTIDWHRAGKGERKPHRKRVK